MGDFLNIGNDGFKSIRKGRYVDKSGMISFINATLGTMNKLTCVSRPRRFGKSYATQMLCAYYDKGCDSKKLFEDLAISKDHSFEEHLNKYDVIYLDMTWFISQAMDKRHIVQNIQKVLIDELYEAYPQAKKKDTLSEALSTVCEITKSKFIFIIDEWDALFREKKEDTELQKEYIELLRTLFKSPFTSKTIEAAYITGILPIKKYGTQSAMTDFYEYTMLDPEPLETYVGFTDEEVKKLCETSEIRYEDLKSWYDGYIIGNNVHIYSPKSVLDAVNRNRLGSYWTKTETYEVLKLYIDLDFDGLKEAIMQMLGEESCSINTMTFQNDMTNIQSRDDVLTLLVHLGYLSYDNIRKTVCIPNKEIRQEFISAVETGRHKEAAALIKNSERLLAATLRMDSDAVAESIEKAHSEVTSPLFYNDEQALRSTIRFAYISCIDEFLRIEELPAGIGYADVVYLPKKGSAMPAIIIELKWNKSAEGAIGQIKENNYPQVLDGFGGDVLLVGVNYDAKTKKHTCIIERKQL